MMSFVSCKSITWLVKSFFGAMGLPRVRWCLLCHKWPGFRANWSTDISTVQYLCTMMWNVYHYCLLISVLHSVSILSTDVSTAQYWRTIVSNAKLLCTVHYILTACHYCVLTSVLYSIYVMCTDVSTAQYVGTVYCVSTAQYDLRTISNQYNNVL